MTNLTKQKVPFSWRKEQQEAFDTQKNALITATALSHPDYSRTMEIHPDASYYGIGAALAQRTKEGKKQTFGFISRLLKGSEINYVCPEK